MDLFMRLSLCTLAEDQTFKGSNFYGKCVQVKDGDTVRLAFFAKESDYEPTQLTCRLRGLDTPEMKPKKDEPRRDEIMRMAQKAASFVRGLIENRIVWFTCDKYDKYGRLLVTVWYKDERNGDWRNLNEDLLTLGYAKPYDGKGKKPAWP